MVLTVSFVLSLVTALSCHHRKRNAQTLSPLDASVGASGPHDFAVRKGAARLASLSRPSHPVPNVRDDREAPLFRVQDGVGSKAVSINPRNELFLRTGLDDPNQIESFQQIAVYVDAISGASKPDQRSDIEKNATLICPSGKSARRCSVEVNELVVSKSRGRG